MSPDEVIFAPCAEREIRKLTKDNQRLVFGVLRDFRDGTKVTPLEKLKGHPKFYRIKVGKNLRLIFHPMTSNRIVILVIRDRKDAYRGLNQLDSKLENFLHIVENDAKKAIGYSR